MSARTPTPAASSRASRAVVRLFWQSAAYSLGNLAIKGAGLLLLPLYLDPALLPQADYGYLGLIETAAQLAIAATGLGLASGLLRYGSMAADPQSRDAYLATAFITVAVLAAATLLASLAFAAPIASVLVGDAARASAVGWAGAYVALKVIGAVPYMLLRVRERPGIYLAALTAEVLVLVAGVWYALAVAAAGLEGVMAAFAASALASALPLSVLVARRLGGGWRPRLARQLLRFGMPLTMAALAGILLNTGDRFVLEALAGPEVLAVYVLASKFGGLVNMLFVQSFNMAFAVLGLKAIGDTRATDFHRRVFRHFVVLAGWGVLAIAVLARDLTDFLSPHPNYLAAEPLILPIALGFLLYGVYYLVVTVLYAAERTGQVALMVLGAALFNLALNIALVPILGAMGAALATLVSYGLLMGAAVAYARRALPLRLPWSALVSTLLLIVGLWAAVQPSLGWALEARLAMRIGVVLAYPALVLIAGLYSLSEVREVVAVMRRRTRG